MIGMIRRECLDHVIVLNEAHLCRVLSEYLEYYHQDRPDQRLGRGAPEHRAAESNEGQIISLPRVGGLHHRYKRAA